MDIVQCSNLSFDYGGGTLFRNINLTITEGDRFGLIGPNGSGKTTLFRLLAGELEATGGTVTQARGAAISVVPQDYAGPADTTVRSVLLSHVAPLRQALSECETRLAAINAQDYETLERELGRYQRLTEEYEQAAGPESEVRAETALTQLELSHTIDCRMGDLSGGERNLVLIAAAMTRGSDLILFDEPGNHLDFDRIEWLERILRELDCATVIVSHNRYMLDRTADAILELDGAGLRRFAGGYSKARMEKLREAAAQGARFQAQQKKFARLEALVARLAQEAHGRPDPSKGKQLRARRTQLEKAKEEAVELQELSGRRPEILLDAEGNRADIAIDIRDYSKRVPGGRTLFDSANLTVTGGERVGLVGANGSGKTTLIRDIVENGSWDSDHLRVNPSARIGYLAQHPAGYERSETVLDQFHRWTSLPLPRARAMLDRYLFSARDVEKPLRALSGGERNRLELARLVAGRADLLLLDEPTNHLDIPSREAIEDALLAFEGTVLLVSHDRYLLDSVCTRIVAIEGGQLVDYPGGFSEYRRRSRAGRAGQGSSRRGRAGGVRGSNVSGALGGHGGAGGAGRSSSPRRQVGAAGPNVDGRSQGGGSGQNPGVHGANGQASIEEQIMALEDQAMDLERQLEEAYSRRDFGTARSIGTKLEKVRSRVEELYGKWG